ncbi:MAG: archaellin/type IV pilin N-terminal domain-containing protein [Candidatus Heimdallarchaeaceae archaeon]
MSNHVFKKNRAVSPVIATVLIIALVIAAVAVVWLVVMPMLQPSDSLLAGYPSFSDENQNYFYDQITILITNSGTKNIVPKALLIQNSDSGVDLRWNFTVQSRTLIPGTGDEFHAQAVENVTELVGGVNVDLYIAYTLDSSTGSEKEWTLTLGFYLPILVNASADIFQPLQYRTSTDDSSTSRGTFPGPGYSPTLFFLLGVFRNNPSLSADYILQNTGNIPEQDYRPYLNDTTEFTTGNPTDSNFKFIPYNDTGNYPGLVSFYGTSFDSADQLNWQGPGIVYIGFYIYNPTANSMDVRVFYQCDDNAKLYFDGQLLAITDPSWNSWSSNGVEVIIDPGYNYFLFKCQDTGGNFDGQVLFVDIGTTDDLSQLQSRWPILPTQQTFPSDPDALRYRISSDDTGTSSGTFPGPGYSPHKWFILGRFIPGTSSSSTNMQVDYIEASGYANETTYRPYLNSGDTFNTNIGTETNNSFVAYLDVGNQIGLIDFIGGSSSRFDRGDTLNWDSRGIVYAATYINNPKSTSATVGIACQSDDDFYLWVNGELIIDSFADSLSWNEWSALKNITLTPGLNYILVKSGDRGGNWDVNLILVDIGDDDLETFTSVWPTSSPLLTKKNSKIMRTENTCETEEQKSIANIYQNKIKLTNEYRCETYTIIGTVKQPFVYSLIRRDVLFYF